jgi:membrane-associated phospholipid phosphatase
MNSTHWRGFIICQLLGLGLLTSWLLPATRSVWDSVDHAVFFALNGTLATPSAWGAFWALLSFRLMDLMPLVVLLPFLLMPDLIFPRTERATACAHLFFILLAMLVVRTVVDGITEALHWRGDSPSRVLQPAYLLSQLYPALHPKDGSNQSFPGDHAAVLMIVVSFLLLRGINRWSFFILPVALLFLMPRLMAGAHWLTDVVVGGTLVASQALAYGYFTPWPKRWAARLVEYGRAVLQR